MVTPYLALALSVFSGSALHLSAGAAPAAAVETTASGQPLTSTFRTVTWAGFGVGAALVVSGAITAGLARGDANRLRSDEPLSPAEVSATASRGAALQTTGAVLLGVGVPVTLVCLWLGLFAAPGELVVVAPGVSRDGAYVSFAGALPW